MPHLAPEESPVYTQYVLQHPHIETDSSLALQNCLNRNTAINNQARNKYSARKVCSWKASVVLRETFVPSPDLTALHVSSSAFTQGALALHLLMGGWVRSLTMNTPEDQQRKQGWRQAGLTRLSIKRENSSRVSEVESPGILSSRLDSFKVKLTG